MSQAIDMPVDNAAPQPGWRILLVVVLILLSTVLWVAAAVQVLFVLPRFEKLFNDFAMKIPFVTEQVIRQSWWVAPTCFFVAGVTCFTTRSRWVRRICLILAPLILNLLMGMSLYFPYTALVAGLGGRNPWNP
jgi:type II secretory pathway component PulF